MKELLPDRYGIRLIVPEQKNMKEFQEVIDKPNSKRFGDVVGKRGLRLSSANIIALIGLVAAINAIGFPPVLDFFRQLLWLPNLVVALVTLVIGGLAARALSSLVRDVTARADFSNPDLLGTITNVAVWMFASVMAINQVEIADTLIGAIMATVGAVAL